MFTPRSLMGFSALLVILLSVGYASWSLLANNKPSVSNRVAFIDTETHEVQSLTWNDYPPLLGKSGRPTLVRAGFFTCDANCKNRQLYFLERYTPDAKAALDAARANPDDPALAAKAQAVFESNTGLEVRKPDGTDLDWVPAQSPQGQAIYASLKCTGGSLDPKPCGD